VRTGKNVSPALQEALKREGLDTVEGAFAYTGGEELSKPNLAHRRRTRLSIKDADGQTHELYLKRYEREKLSERLRRWWTYGSRMSPGGVEFDNIEAMQDAHLTSMQCVICGEQWSKRGAKRSYLIVTAVPGCKLEACISEFLDTNANRPKVLREFTITLGRLVARLHVSGFVHRDLYSAHVFLDESGGQISLSLIDLGRAFRPKLRRLRWKVKDLAQLKYSMPRKRWVERYWDMFLRTYLSGSEPGVLRKLDRRIDRKVALMRFRNRKRKIRGE
jgi:tRNA A-37 threonylcarbamoyl transferase component Bud32